MKDITSEFCEACRQTLVETIIESRNRQWPYRLCFPCAHRLVTLSLRPAEWFHLAVLHGSHEHYLHDDFYSEDGKALQPKESIVEPEKWLLPALVQDDLVTLIDYAITRFYLVENGPVIEMLKQQDTTHLLAEIRRRANLLTPFDREARLYMICAYTLGNQADSWIREAWETYHEETFSSLAIASSYCLPLSEGFDRVVSALATLSPEKVRSTCLVLRYFHDSRTLAWLETHVQPPITDVWGRVAASSSFSWEWAAKWLDLGRPLSLVALDALTSCFNYEISHPTSPRRFLGHISKETMLLQLEIYLKKDPVPRVREKIAQLIQRIEQGV